VGENPPIPPAVIADLRVYNVVCPACFTALGRATFRDSDALALAHDCPASPEEQEQAIINVEFAALTGDTTALLARNQDK
jgi:hypothetical protein